MKFPGTSPIRPKVLSARLIPDPHQALSVVLGDKSKRTSYGLVTCDRDHALFVALDEATKAAPVTVHMARQLFGGRFGAPDPLSGEAFGILKGEDDEVVREGLKAVLRTLEDSAWMYETTGSRAIPFFPHVLPSLGAYLSETAGLAPGEPMAYLMGPPLESLVALDAAFKAADVKLVKHFAPPTSSNFGGAFLTGPLEECQAAAEAFAAAMVSVAERPIDRLGSYSYVRTRPAS